MNFSRIIILAGSGRSGTTWVGDVLASCRGCCSVFEPLNTDRVPAAPRWGQSSGSPGCYLRPDEEHPQWREFFGQLFSGQISNAWTRQDWRLVARRFDDKTVPVLTRFFFRLAKTRNSFDAWRASTLVVKTIRSNLLLPWLQKAFPVEILHLIRNPCAVIGSRLRLGWPYELDDIYAQPALMEDLVSPYSKWLESASTPVEKLAVLWCVENLVPLEMASQGLCRSISYEEFAADPETAFSDLLNELRLTPTRATRQALGRRVSAPSEKKRETDIWHAPLTREEGERVMEIVSEFGIHLYAPPLYGVQNSACS